MVALTSAQLPTLQTAPPPQFGGPGGVWSPETLLCAALADCFILTFRAVSRAARYEWLQLDCRVEGTLERAGELTQFTRYATFVKLEIPAGGDTAKGRELIQRAEHGCLIANSLRGTRSLQAEVVIDRPMVAEPIAP